MKITKLNTLGCMISLILLIAFASMDAYCASIAEREALVALYNSTDGPNWVNSTGWLGEEGTECTWYGVTCENSKVTVINLDSNQLTGNIPPKIENLINLRGMYLYLHSLYWL